jgi:hypothetical protein
MGRATNYCLLIVATMLCSCANLRSPSERGGYDVPTHLESDVGEVVTIEFCEISNLPGAESSAVMKPFATITSSNELRSVTTTLASVQFVPMPNQYRSVGVPLYVAFLDQKRQPKFIVSISSIGSVVRTHRATRDKKGNLRIISANIYNAPPNYSARDEDFAKQILELLKQYDPARWNYHIKHPI